MAYFVFIKPPFGLAFAITTTFMVVDVPTEILRLGFINGIGYFGQIY
jgi:hypothetical protein